MNDVIYEGGSPSRDITAQFSVEIELKRLAVELGGDVFVCVPHGHACCYPPTTLRALGAALCVYIWSVPDSGRNRRKDVPDTIWGVTTRDDALIHDYAYSVSGLGVDIADGNFSVAELIDKKYLYILLDLTHRGSKQELEILKILVDKVIAIVKES